MKAVVRIHRTPQLARRAYLKAITWILLCVTIMGIVIFGGNLNPGSSMAWPGFFWAITVLGAAVIGLVLHKWLVVEGILAVVYAQRTSSGWRVGSLGGFMRGNTVEVFPIEPLSLSSRAESDRVRSDGRQVGYRWTIKQGNRKVSFSIEAQVTAVERKQLENWWDEYGSI